MSHNEITLRKTELSECDNLFPIFSDESIVRYTNFKKFGDIDSFRGFMDRLLNLRLNAPLQYGPYSIYLNNSITGLCGAQQKNSEEGSVELWYILHKNYWGKGLAEQAAELVMQECKKNKALKSIYAEAVTINAGSWTILEKLGFVKTGESKAGFIKGDICEDLWHYSYSCNS